MQSPYKPNTVHHWLAGKRLVTQNINGLDGKAGNDAYVPIQGRLDKVTVLHEQGTIYLLHFDHNFVAIHY